VGISTLFVFIINPTLYVQIRGTLNVHCGYVSAVHHAHSHLKLLQGFLTKIPLFLCFTCLRAFLFYRFDVEPAADNTLAEI
jgi:hypothetical protein